jgi:NADPH:quinone reductase-like Zn-dependent oxidoreductase
MASQFLPREPCNCSPAAIVAALGDSVSGFAVGDEVYAMVRFPEALMTGSGAYAEYVTVPVAELALKPTGIDHA